MTEMCVSPLPNTKTPIVVATPGGTLEETPMIKKLRIKKEATPKEIANIEGVVVVDLINKIKRIVKLQHYHKEDTEKERVQRKKIWRALEIMLEGYRQKFIMTFRPEETETDDEESDDDEEEDDEDLGEVEMNGKEIKTDNYGNERITDYDTLLPTSEEEEKPLSKAQPDCLINIKYLAAELIADITQDKHIKVLPPPTGFKPLSEKKKTKCMNAIAPYQHAVLFSLQLMHQYPMIVFIGGTSGVGKSTITTKLAHLFNVTRLISTDHVRDIYRAVHKPEYKAYLDKVEKAKETGEKIKEPMIKYPPSDIIDLKKVVDETPWEPEIPISLLYKSSFQTGSLKEGDLVPNFEKQAGFLLSFLAEFIHTSWAKRPEPIIIEGVHMTPRVQQLLINSLSTLKTKPLIYRMSVIMHSPMMHQLHLESRSTIAQIKKGVANRYVSKFKEIRAIQHHLISPMDTNIDYCHILIDTSHHVDYIMQQIAKNMIEFWLKHAKLQLEVDDDDEEES